MFKSTMFNSTMFKSLKFKSVLPLTLLPLLAFAQPAEARHLFWWQMIGPDGEVSQPQYPAYDDPQLDDAYADDQATQDMFNQREYELYKREMRKQQGYDANYDPQFDYQDQPRYAPQPRLTPKKKLVIKKPMPVALGQPTYKPPQVSTGPVTQAKPGKVANLAGVSCSKGSSIVSSFGFSSVATKSCNSSTLIYSASRGGKNFEVEVSAASGELTAVKKL